MVPPRTLSLSSGWCGLNQLRQPIVQTVAVADGQLERPLVGDEHQYVPRGVEHCGAVSAVGEVVFDIGTHFRIDCALDVIRDLAPNVLAT
ncbi:hypothetical protein Acid345_0524 [Candidatus Koribacter versatilis Ellin345]|uniref:Uncharacterized protein n=1 Tax=Koribacter versatilis (strain Ellin345) TaxID=204669 RepID=Q1IUC1_KORVE|nr:hypothetical protein Acid345_0524 [Candidatus Koribacter versatilis Ellin345]